MKSILYLFFPSYDSISIYTSLSNISLLFNFLSSYIIYQNLSTFLQNMICFAILFARMKIYCLYALYLYLINFSFAISSNCQNLQNLFRYLPRRKINLASFFYLIQSQCTLYCSLPNIFLFNFFINSIRKQHATQKPHIG